MQADTLFLNDVAKYKAILLIDASGSVTGIFSEASTIFDRIRKVVTDLPEDEFRVIFWNADRIDHPFFKGGIYKLPFVVKKNTIGQTFNHVKSNINNTCLTFPHLGFDNISADWIDNVNPTRIYFITDGEMGYTHITFYEKNDLKMKLSNSIKNIFTKYNNVQLHIITVEAQNRDFSQMETLTRAAGCDVYNVIMENRLTNYITRFVSYTLNHSSGFVHIQKNIPPPGHIPFEDRYFSQLRVPEFIQYLATMIQKTNPDEDALLKIVQSLSTSLCYLTRDKPKHIIDGIIQMFCSLFNGTVLDSMFVQFILCDAVRKENEGMAQTFTVYRAQLKDLYKQATELLKQDVKKAVGVGEYFMSLPIDGKIITGHCRLIDQNLNYKGTNYPNAALKINDIIVPILPNNTVSMGLMNDQCLRQWTRVLISKQYNVNVVDDSIIYIVLGIMLNVVLSDDIPNQIKDSYRMLGTTMLKKKRMNTNQTELERLETGELPIPNNGKIENFYDYMNRVSYYLKIKVNPMTLWYAICLGLNNNNLITKQLIHCKESILHDFPGIDAEHLLTNLKSKMTPMLFHQIPFEIVLDYNCLITTEDISMVGGFRFLSHQTITGATCNPVYVLSVEGYKQLLSDSVHSVCPICYTALTESHFEKTGPKPAQDALSVFSKNTQNIFDVSITSSLSATAAAACSSTSASSSLTSSSSKKGTLIIMKGVVGCGKTTFSEKLKVLVESAGGYCVIEGVDKYCKTGMAVGQAVNCVRDVLQKAKEFDHEKKVIIVDTCGEKGGQNTDIYFDVNFGGWKKVIIWPNKINGYETEYLAWSLRNVLQRGPSTDTSNYWLNPDKASVSTCIDIHKKKAFALIGKKVQVPPVSAFDTKDLAISKLKDKADAYQTLLNTQKPLDAEVKKAFDGLGL